jgi:hypothetical protein
MSFADKSQPRDRDDDNPIDEALATAAEAIKKPHLFYEEGDRIQHDGKTYQVEKVEEAGVHVKVYDHARGGYLNMFVNGEVFARWVRGKLGAQAVEQLKRGNPRKRSAGELPRYTPNRCAICGKVYYTHHRTSKTCSDKCRKILSRQK